MCPVLLPSGVNPTTVNKRIKYQKYQFSMSIENKINEHQNQSTISNPVHDVIVDVFVLQRMQLSLSLHFASMWAILIKQSLLLVQYPLNVY
jgi:hypothetical protein